MAKKKTAKRSAKKAGKAKKTHRRLPARDKFGRFTSKKKSAKKRR